MEKRLRLFAVALGATRLNSNFKESRRNDGTFIFRRRSRASSSTGGPINFQLAAIAVVAHSEHEAQDQGLAIARELMPESEGWTNCHAYCTEIAELQTLKKGFV